MTLKINLLKLLVLVTPWFFAASNAVSKSPMIKSEKRDGVMFTLSSENGHDNTNISFEINNASPATIVFIGSEISPRCDISITNEQGQTCEKTKEGLVQFAGLDNDNVFFQIAPGENKKWLIPLAKYFNLKSGKWTLKFNSHYSVSSISGAVHEVHIPDFEITVK